tara:strand:- start:1496 stop:2923 length:1428 start_codon:yes stop_codon:yes gene_type:complete
MSDHSIKYSDKKKKSWVSWTFFTVFLCVFAWAYTYLATILVVGTNTSRTGIQTQYIDSVYQAAAVSEGPAAMDKSISSRFTRALPQYTNGLIDPLWPWLMQNHAQETPDILFEQGKWTNVVLSGSLLILFGIGAARAFSFMGSAAMILMGGFGVVLERSAYFSPDALYYLLVVLAWLCALSMIRQNLLWMYGVFGLLMGVAYLAKALVWPIALGFVIVSVIRSIACAVDARKNGETDTLWVSANQLVGIAMMATAFLLVVGPRMSYSNTQFGAPFHSYQNYNVWMDSPAEAVRFQKAYSGRDELSELTPEDRPGIVKFIREKGGLELFSRAWKGALSQLESSVLGRGGWILLYGLFVFVVVASIHRWAKWKQKEEIWRVRGTSARWMLLFMGIVLAVTLFYTGIGNAVYPYNSMTTSLFLPVLLTFVWIAERYRRQLMRSPYAKLVNRVHCVLMVLPIIWITIRIVQAIQAPVPQ